MNLFQDVQRVLSTVVSGVTTLTRAVSTTVGEITTEDNDLREFEGGEFNTALKFRLDAELLLEKKKRREKELSVDSGVSTAPVESQNDTGSEKDLDEFAFLYTPDHVQTDGHVTHHVVEHVECGSTSSTASSLSVSSDEEFFNGLNFLSMPGDPDPEPHPDEITSVTADDISSLTSSSEDEFSLGTVNITSTEVYVARKRCQSAETRSIQRTTSLNNSGRRSFNDLHFTPLSQTPRSKSTNTLSLQSDDTIPRNTLHSLDMLKSRSEVSLHTIIEKPTECLKNSVRFNNFVHVSHQDPTTIESFDSLSDMIEETRCDTLSEFDEDDDLLEKRDPFRESFISGPLESVPKVATNRPDQQQFSSLNCVMRKSYPNFNVGACKNKDERTTPDQQNSENSIIETISEISHTKSQKSCSIARKTPVKLKPLPKIKAQYKTSLNSKEAAPKSVIGKENTFRGSGIPTRIESKSRAPLYTPAPNLSKRKNHLNSPSEKSPLTPPKWSVNNISSSPRSLNSRSVSCSNLNTRTEDLASRSGTLDGINSLDKTKSYADLTYTPAQFPTESSPTEDAAERSVTLLNSSSLSNIGDRESFSSIDGNSNSTGSSSSTFYSFSASSQEHQEPEDRNVILNGKSSKTFMVNMKNSFKRLASFLSLSSSKAKSLKDPVQPNITPVPPPAHTKPKYRPCIRPVTPSNTQRSISCGNLTKPAQSTLPKSYLRAPEDTLTEEDGLLSGIKPDYNRTVVADNGKLKKKLKPAPSLINHINNHYHNKGQRLSGNSLFGSSSSSTSVRFPTPSRKSIPEMYKSSPSFLPSPPTQRKPVWRETKASRLRLNRVKAPSMSALNLYSRV